MSRSPNLLPIFAVALTFSVLAGSDWLESWLVFQLCALESSIGGAWLCRLGPTLIFLEPGNWFSGLVMPCLLNVLAIASCFFLPLKSMIWLHWLLRGILVQFRLLEDSPLLVVDGELPLGVGGLHQPHFAIRSGFCWHALRGYGKVVEPFQPIWL